MTFPQAFDAPTTPTPAPAPSPSAAGSAPTGPAPTISANRRRLDNRFPVLAFSVRTQGRPWFEVLLTTDRSLFDPANAAKRTPATFYAGRQDGGLARAAGEDTAYVVPAAVLRRFAGAIPRPSDIFYTVAAYDRPDGPPTLAQPVAILATTAPSVALSRDFQAQTMAVVLGVPADKLAPVDTVAPAVEAAGFALADIDDEDLGVGQSWSSEEDEARALEQATSAWFEDPAALALDDATGLDDQPLAPEPPQELAFSDDDAGPWAAEAYADPGSEMYVEERAYDHGYATGNGTAAGYDEAGTHAYGDDAEPDPAGAFDYDDGYDTLEDDVEEYGIAADSTWPAGAQEPGQLADADDARLDDELAMELADVEPYDDAQAYDPAPTYGDAQAYDPAPTYGDAQAYDHAPSHDEPADGAQGFADEDDYAEDLDTFYGEEPAAAALEAPLDIPGKIAIVTKLGRLFESRDLYAGINADTEFSNPRMPQYQRWHVGLSYGLVQFTQDSGGLGALLRMMRDRDPARFREIFGPDADALVEVTGRSGPSGREVPGGRSVRVQPVGGADLWTEPWLSRFRAAGAHPPFQAAQNELAVRRYLDPVLVFAGGFGLTTERALAMVVDRSIQMGVGGARRWITEAIGPIRTDAQRQQALGALGLPDIVSFQRQADIRQDGDFGPLTHAALVGALRRLGPASPIPIPTREQMLDAIVARAQAANVFWKHRPRTIRTSREFADAPLTWPAPTPAPTTSAR